MTVRRFVLHRRVWRGQNNKEVEWEPFIVRSDEIFRISEIESEITMIKFESDTGFVEFEVNEPLDMIFRLAEGRALSDEED